MSVLLVPGAEGAKASSAALCYVVRWVSLSPGHSSRTVLKRHGPIILVTGLAGGGRRTGFACATDIVLHSRF